jgi:hypothetical protein
LILPVTPASSTEIRLKFMALLLAKNALLDSR